MAIVGEYLEAFNLPYVTEADKILDK